MKTSAATTESQHLLYDPAELAAARAIAVLVPGALTSVGMFEATDAWRAQGYGLVRHRFPGLDGRALHPALDIKGAGTAIAALGARYPGKPLRLLGYSTGAAVVLEAAAGMGGDVRLALLAPAVPRAGGLQTGLRSGAHIARAIWQARSPRVRAFWLRYYAVLLYGTTVWRDPQLRARASEIIAARRDRIVFPTPALIRAHTRDLWRWSGPRAVFAPGQVQIFRGAQDPVFSAAQTGALAQHCGAAAVTAYAGEGHLLFASHPAVFDDILAFFDGPAAA